MRIAGIVAEYNPFHRGHEYHVLETKRATGCDWVVACMGGHFTQRGEPTPFSRWARAQMALSCGVDAVFELPTLFALQNAEGFARGGVGILSGLGVDTLSFGSEVSDLHLIQQLADLADDEPKAVSEAIRAALQRGEAYARARGSAYAAHLGVTPALLNRPNLTLAVEYLRAIHLYGGRMEPVAIPRLGDYHDTALQDYASASAIRLAMQRGEDILPFIPRPARPFAVPESLHGMDDLLLDRLRQMTPSDLGALPEVAEGLEHRLFRLCRQTGTREDLLLALKCKRYTHARLSRTLTHALLGIDKTMLLSNPHPTCARLIGLRRGAEPLLKELQRRSSLPIAASPKALSADIIFQVECRATDLWSLLHDDPALRLPGREYTEGFVRQ